MATSILFAAIVFLCCFCLECSRVVLQDGDQSSNCTYDNLIVENWMDMGTPPYALLENRTDESKLSLDFWVGVTNTCPCYLATDIHLDCPDWNPVSHVDPMVLKKVGDSDCLYLNGRGLRPHAKYSVGYVATRMTYMVASNVNFWVYTCGNQE